MTFLQQEISVFLETAASEDESVPQTFALAHNMEAAARQQILAAAAASATITAFARLALSLRAASSRLSANARDERRCNAVRSKLDIRVQKWHLQIRR